MIRHIVLFSAKDPAEIPLLQTALAQLATIPDARHLEVVPNAKRDQLSSEIDLVVYGEFDDFAQLDRRARLTVQFFDDEEPVLFGSVLFATGLDYRIHLQASGHYGPWRDADRLVTRPLGMFSPSLLLAGA